MCVQPILLVKVSINFNIMLNFEGDFDGHGDDDVACKQTCIHVYSLPYRNTRQVY